VLFLGSDGRDDLQIGTHEGARTINENERLFLDIVQEANGRLGRVVELVRASGELTDDLSLMRVGFHEPAEAERAQAQEAAFDLYRARHYAEAAGRMRELLSSSPQDPELLFMVSLCYKHLKQIPAATEMGERLHSLQPDRIANLVNLADNYRILGDFDRSREILMEALKINPYLESAKRLEALLHRQG